MATRMATPVALGAIKDFDPEVDRIVPYLERVQLYLLANQVEAESKVPAFLSIIGGRAYGVLRDLLAPALPQDTSLERLVATLKKHYEPSKVVIAERFHFHRREQQAEESIAEFLAALRRLATHCQFGDHLEDSLRDRLVCGLRSESIQKKLLSEVDLTLQRALEIVQGMESAERALKQENWEVPANNVVLKCHRCGKSNHKPSDCRFLQATCHSCGKKGHISPVCPSASQDRKYSRGRDRRRQKTNWLETDSPADESNLPIYSVRTRTRPISVELEVNGKTLTMEVDTGAAVSIISQKVQEKLLPNVEVRPSRVLLRTYTGQHMSVVGEITVEVKYAEQAASLVLIVVKGEGPSLFGRNWFDHITLDWKQIASVNDGPTPSDKVKSLCGKFPDLFKEELGSIKSHTGSIKIANDAQPKFVKARTVPYSIREAVGEELDRMESQGILEPVMHSEWATPIIAIPKSDGRYRVCGDFKVTLNPVMSVDHYPLPKPQDLFASLSGGEKFTVLDLAQAYLQLPLDEQTQKLVVVNTHKGLYKFKRLPFGVASAPAMFQKVMDTLLQGIPGVACFIDDIIVTGATEEEHLKSLERVMKVLQDHGVRLKLSKCRFMQDQVEYLGLIIDKHGLHASPEKVRAVLEAPKPRNIKELRAFLGMMNYYRKCIPNLATMLKPLTNLLQKNCRWLWRAAQARAFKEAKQVLTSMPVLTHYNQASPVRLATDASAYGVGAVLSHVGPEGEERPIAFASRMLTATEARYAQIEREALGIVFGVQKFHQYLYGRRFTLITDHKPLTTIFGPKKGVPALAAARLQRWAIQLSAYVYDIEYRSTAQHGNADGLSRLPVQGSYVEEGPEIREFQVHQLQSLPVRAADVRKATLTLYPVSSSIKWRG